MERFRERSRLIIGAPVAIAISGLVRHVVLHRNNKTTTPPQRGGWVQIPHSELLDAVADTVAPVIPINTSTIVPATPEVRKVIEVEDILTVATSD